MFPAHAGMNRRPYPEGEGVFDVPRTRGDEPPLVKPDDLPDACSPHTRG